MEIRASIAAAERSDGPLRGAAQLLRRDLRIGGHVIKRPVVFFDEDVEDAWLGSAILVNSRLELDTERRVMRLTSTSPLASPSYRTLGLGLGAFDADSGTRPVTDVIPGTPAAVGAIEVGDRVLSLGGVPAEELDAYARRALAAASDSAELVLIRGGKTLSLQLKVAALP
jgi:S1-C subfamily serine protease